ncbi:MAG: QcrA and Rieske domain-containing protein [Myxococcaceae bacterium]
MSQTPPTNRGPGISRRRWSKGLLLLASLPFIGGVEALGRWRRARTPGQRLSLPRPLADGAQFHGEVILVRAGERVQAFWARCPHLGCRIRRAEEGALVCPCHGSRFDGEGRRLSGPATSDLRPLAIEPDPQRELLFVIVPV